MITSFLRNFVHLTVRSLCLHGYAVAAQMSVSRSSFKNRFAGASTMTPNFSLASVQKCFTLCYFSPTQLGFLTSTPVVNFGMEKVYFLRVKLVGKGCPPCSKQPPVFQHFPNPCCLHSGRRIGIFPACLPTV